MATRNALSLSLKRKLQAYARESKSTQAQLVHWASNEFGFTIGRSTIGKILKVDIAGEHNDQKRRGVCQFPELETKLFNLIVSYEDTVYITGDIIIAKARSVCAELNIKYDDSKLTMDGYLGSKRGMVSYCAIYMGNQAPLIRRC
jgi:hypothetical protein